MWDNEDENNNNNYPPEISTLAPSRPRPIYPPEEPQGRPIYTPAPPTIPQGRPTPFRVHLGERAELNCNAEEGNVRTEWKRVDGQPLPYGTSIRGGQLIIENVQHDAEGVYQCLAYDRNRRPFILVNAQLVVIAGPPKIVFNPLMPITVRSGEDVEIFCNATGEQPIRVQWHGEGGSRLPS